MFGDEPVPDQRVDLLGLLLGRDDRRLRIRASGVRCGRGGCGCPGRYCPAATSATANVSASGAGPDRQGQVRVPGVPAAVQGAEPVHRVQLHHPGGRRGRVLQDTAAADRRQLVGVAEPADPYVRLVRDVRQRAGRGLIEHPGLVHDQHVPAAQRVPARAGVHPVRVRVELADRQPVPHSVVVPPPPVGVHQGVRGVGVAADLPGGDHRRDPGRRHHDQPAALVPDQPLRGGQHTGFPSTGRPDDHREPIGAGDRRDRCPLLLVQ
jgi:hypothetical protein